MVTICLSIFSAKWYIVTIIYCNFLEALVVVDIILCILRSGICPVY